MTRPESMFETRDASASPEQAEKFDMLLHAFLDELSRSAPRLFRRFDDPPLTEVAAYREIKDLHGREKVAFVRHLLDRNIEARSHMKIGEYADFAGTPAYLSFGLMTLFRSLLKAKIDFAPEDAVSYIAEFLDLNARDEKRFRLDEFPFGFATTQLERSLKGEEPTQALRERIKSILANPAFEAGRYHYGSDLKRVGTKLLKLASRGDGAASPPPYLRLGGDPFGETVADDLAAMPEDEQPHWHTLFHEANAVSGAKPPKKYLTTANGLIDEIGAARYKSQVQAWLQLAIDVPVRSEQHPHVTEYTVHTYLTGDNNNLLKGLVWTLLRFHDATTLRLVARFAERCFEKIPGVGPTAAGVGNACILVLAQSKGLDGVSHLSRLKLRIRQSNTRKLIQTHIEEQAAKLGLKPAQIEELAAPDFDLELGERHEAFDDYTLTLTLSGVGKVDLQWIKPDGKPQKSVPAFVKSSKKHADRLKKLRATAKEIQQSSTAQRDRIDRLYVEDMSWAYEDFRKLYLDHGVVSQIARKLIWQLAEDGRGTAALYVDGAWQSVTGEAISPGPDTTVRMWHPIDTDPETVLAWRDRLDALGMTQPMKQAYREVYIVTDAELITRSYSNRMAAHILKQHQFSALSGLRGWKYSLLGAYDDGRENEAAQKALTAYGITAEYWIDEILDDAERFNDAGIWDYVATDQVRFLDANNNTMNMVDVPSIVFSEIMRDVDLFVGVASVGNDPAWQDSGATREQRDYWHTYSFGDLTEVAKTRKAVLERLLPRLKIRDQAHIDGKFLIIDGKRHSYKIHIGSTNILILPNDRYLCIVPGRSTDKSTSNIHLPFEGDRGLSIILSKAFMLADDDKITDPTILSQL